MTKPAYPANENGSIMHMINEIAATAVAHNLKEINVSVGRTSFQLRVELKRQ